MVGEDDQLESGRVELIHGRALVDRRHADERRVGAIPLLRERDDLVRILALRVDEHHVGAGVGVGAAAHQRLFHAPAGDERLGARDHHEIRVLLRGLGRADLAGVLFHRRELALHACVEAAALGEDVVLHADRGDAGALVLLDAADHVDRVAVPIVAVGDHGDLRRVVHHLRGVEVLRHREDVRVGDGVARGDLEARGPEAFKSSLLADLPGEPVVGADDHDRAGAGHEFAELPGFRHVFTSPYCAASTDCPGAPDRAPAGSRRHLHGALSRVDCGLERGRVGARLASASWPGKTREPRKGPPYHHPRPAPNARDVPGSAVRRTTRFSRRFCNYRTIVEDSTPGKCGANPATQARNSTACASSAPRSIFDRSEADEAGARTNNGLASEPLGGSRREDRQHLQLVEVGRKEEIGCIGRQYLSTFPVLTKVPCCGKRWKNCWRRCVPGCRGMP